MCVYVSIIINYVFLLFLFCIILAFYYRKICNYLAAFYFYRVPQTTQFVYFTQFGQVRNVSPKEYSQYNMFTVLAIICFIVFSLSLIWLCGKQTFSYCIFLTKWTIFIFVSCFFKKKEQLLLSQSVHFVFILKKRPLKVGLKKK